MNARTDARMDARAHAQTANPKRVRRYRADNKRVWKNDMLYNTYIQYPLNSNLRFDYRCFINIKRISFSFPIVLFLLIKPYKTADFTSYNFYVLLYTFKDLLLARFI